MEPVATLALQAGRRPLRTRLDLADGRYVCPACLGDRDLKVRCPRVESRLLLGGIGVAVIGAD